MSSKPYTIKFSHYYLKMGDFNLDKPFTLVAAWYTNLESLTPSFIDYDTTYIENVKASSISFEGELIKKYSLPKGDLITLYLVQDYKLMTTVRRYTVEKFHFYSTLVGKEVMLKIEEKHNSQF